MGQETDISEVEERRDVCSICFLCGDENEKEVN
jgi:hypothetical protein